MEAELIEQVTFASVLRRALEGNVPESARLAQAALLTVAKLGSLASQETLLEVIHHVLGSPVLHTDPVSILAGGGVAIAFLFVLLLEKIDGRGVTMRSKMPDGFVETIEKTAGLVEKLKPSAKSALSLPSADC